ncbi:MAG: ketopantoate reductase family protein [Acidobacteriota bacterium]
MHYGIIGMGPVGATFAALLTAGGKRVSVLDSNPHRAELLRKEPLTITGAYKSEAQLQEVFTAFDDFVASDPEVVLIAIKTHALRDVLGRVKNSALKTKALVSCQNGIDTEKEIAEAFGEDHAYRMVLNFGVSYSAANEVSVNFLAEPHFLASVSRGQGQLAGKIAEELNQVGFRVELIDDIATESFKKAILNATLSSICTLTRMTMSEVMNDPELQKMVREMIRESMWICKVSDVDLGEEFLDYAVDYLNKGGNHKPSMLVDIERERQTEIGYLAGKLYEYAAKKDLPVPVTQTMFYLVKSLEKSVMLHKYVHGSNE